MNSERKQACEQAVQWLMGRVVRSARGDEDREIEVEPEGRFWLGRLASQETVMALPFGDRSERMQPCAIGVRVKPSCQPPWAFCVTVSGAAWFRDRAGGNARWRKTAKCQERVRVVVNSSEPRSHVFPANEFADALNAQLPHPDLRCVVVIDVEVGRSGAPELVIQMVNDSPDPRNSQLSDTGIYESEIEVSGLSIEPFQLEALPDSFRYDRRVPAYGVNCGVEVVGENALRSGDYIGVDRTRPVYWATGTPEPDLTFATLAEDPLPSLRQLVDAHKAWGDVAWSSEQLDDRARAEKWSDAMRVEAQSESHAFAGEAARMRQGIELLEGNHELRKAFKLMNEAMKLASRERYQGWRPFQVGFLLANLASCLRGDENAAIVDILWFATGGGKTETYLGLLVTAAFLDRLTGKSSGITAWSRFPLRLLSLQQTQRFANALGAAELVRRRHAISGDAFSLGFFVGDSSTPNRILLEPAPGEPDPHDEAMPSRYQILMRCPFCDAEVEMGFNRRFWRLEHRCINDDCEWPDQALPVYIVDEEIYRFLPTFVVGTLDKVASIAMQASMRGFVGAPYGVCSMPGHGFVYATRAQRPNGCLVPQCRGACLPVEGDPTRFAPTFRLQDELHLLRDSLGAIDSHYESLLDYLEEETSGVTPKIVASSATLSGYARQCEVLYGRKGRIFPLQGPSPSQSFWSAQSTESLRKYIALAPRGATLEFAADRILTELQLAIRDLQRAPEDICEEIGVDARHASDIASLFGVNVVYGNTIRDIDASLRSLETQIPVAPLVTAQLTGHTPFSEVRTILDRLENPEPNFEDRIHVVAASSMMSHGVDIDRLNTMVMLGLPLTTSEFIQATARIGRTYPGLVFVLHKIPLERDASIYRSFRSFVEQGDRFVEAIPITRRSRRVLERTLPGLLMAIICQIHEPEARRALTVIARVRDYFRSAGIRADDELQRICKILHLKGDNASAVREEARGLIDVFFANLFDPAVTERFPSDLFPTGVMRSLRDVEEQAPVQDR